MPTLAPELAQQVQVTDQLALKRKEKDLQVLLFGKEMDSFVYLALIRLLYRIRIVFLSNSHPYDFHSQTNCAKMSHSFLFKKSEQHYWFILQL